MDYIRKMASRHIWLCMMLAAMLLLPQMAAAQARTITGKVVDETDEPLPGATVRAGANEGTITNIDGIFSINTAAKTLTISYVGYEPKTVNIEGKNDLLIRMETNNVLEEVVVIGYGTQKKESVIGAITSVKPEILQQNQTANISNSLVGALPGIIGVQRSGEPGYDHSDFWIRGINTFGANSNPLVIIDGIERTLDNISPEEIESFSVLKDASATAVYGVRGANGAIVIKTKRGMVGAPKVTVKLDYGMTQPLKIAEFVDAAKHMEVINASAALSHMENMPFSTTQISNTRDGVDPDLYPSVNWLDAITKDSAPNGRVSVDVGGGTQLLRYRFVLGVYHEGGIIASDPNCSYDNRIKLTRYNVRSNIDLNLTRSTLFSVSLGGFIQDRHAPSVDINTLLNNAMETPPLVHPIIYSNGQYPRLSNRHNPWAAATEEGYKNTYTSQLQSVATIDQDFGAFWEGFEGLHVKATFSFDNYQAYNSYRSRALTYHIASGRDENGELITSLVNTGDEFLGFSKTFSGNRSVYFELPISYSRRFGKHNVDALLLWNRRSYVDQDASAAIYSFPYRHEGFAGRFAYDFDSRYFAEFNFGYNGSENFAKEYRYGFFPSVAVGWMASNEKFFEDIAHIMPLLRLRGSIGKAGNDQISAGRRFGYLTTINGNAGGHNFGYTNTAWYQGVSEDQFGIPNLTWETATKTNVGIDVGLWGNLNLNLDWFTEKRKDIFMQRKTIPETAGYVNYPWANYGKVENKGFEINLQYNKPIGNDMFITLMGNVTYAKNKITEYDEAASVVGTTRAHTGNSINANYGFIADGLYKDADFLDPEAGVLKPGLPVSSYGTVYPGNIKYRDLNNDGMLTDDDKTCIGHPSVPEVVYGFGFTFKWKWFDISALFQGVGRTDFLIDGALAMPGVGQGTLGNILTNVDDRWTPENPSDNVYYPRLAYGGNPNDLQASTWWLKSGNYLRLKNCEIGVTPTLPGNIKKVVSNFRIFARGTNMLTFSNFKLWDPELVGTGYKTYPLSRIMTFGIDITFN